MQIGGAATIREFAAKSAGSATVRFQRKSLALRKFSRSAKGAHSETRCACWHALARQHIISGSTEPLTGNDRCSPETPETPMTVGASYGCVSAGRKVRVLRYDTLHRAWRSQSQSVSVSPSPLHPSQNSIILLVTIVLKYYLRAVA